MGLVLGSLCTKECHDIWHANIAARQAAAKLKYENRQPELIMTTFPNLDDDEVRKCGYCLQMTPGFLLMCDECGRCNYHPDDGEEDPSPGKHTFQRFMKMSEGLILPSDRPR